MMLKYARRPSLREIIPFCITTTTTSSSSSAYSTAPSAYKLLEEERLPGYSRDLFYPIRVGQVLNSRYKVVGKLGYGSFSTHWLCRDISDNDFVAIKVGIRDHAKWKCVRRELRFHEHVESLGTQHAGEPFVRRLLDTFELAGPYGRHVCMVHPPMHMTIQDLQQTNPSYGLTVTQLKATISSLLRALVFLHDEAEVIHCSIQLSSIMLKLEDDSLLEDFERAEEETPSPHKVIDEIYTIYASRKLGLPKGDLWGQPTLCGFGEMRIGSSQFGSTQPLPYRAPEVLFRLPWNSSIDIWNVGVLMWDLLESRSLFDAISNNGYFSATSHVCEMAAFLGPPPPEYVYQNGLARRLFDRDGLWKRIGNRVVPPLSLEDTITALDDGAEKAQFLDFARLMLRWIPEERMRAVQLLKHPWLAGATVPLTKAEDGT